MPTKARKAKPTEQEKMIAEDNEVIRKGEVWYKKIAAELEKKYDGQFTIIDSETGHYIVADTVIKVILMAEIDPDFKHLTYLRCIGKKNPFINPFRGR